ncbi:MAG: glycine cleavage system protein GcvH [Actinomycetota bacterium]|nr:glycine cleavage system protein GcvH [Actinomycetota bacterium]
MEIEGYNFLEDLYYEKNHFWAKPDDEGQVLMGATDFFQKLAGDIVFIELPMAGTKSGAGQVFSSLESGKWVGKLYAPVSGEIVEVNEELEDEPELINESPYDEGWIVKIKPDNLEAELSNLMKAGPDFEQFIKEEAEKHTQE